MHTAQTLVIFDYHSGMLEHPYFDISHRSPNTPTLAVQGILFDLDNTLFDRDKTFLHWAQWREHMGISANDTARPVVDLLVELDANGYGPKSALFRTRPSHMILALRHFS